MVCEKCEKKGKLGKVITPDPWKAGASNTTQPGGRKVGENKLLTASKNRFNPLTTEFKKCRICKVSPSQQTGLYGTTELASATSEILLCDNLRCLTCILTSLVFSKKSTRWALTTASSALTRKGSVLCAGWRCWRHRDIVSQQPSEPGSPPVLLTLCVLYYNWYQSFYWNKNYWKSEDEESKVPNVLQ